MAVAPRAKRRASPPEPSRVPEAAGPRRRGPLGPGQRQWTTADVGPTERFDYWRDAICAVYVQLDATPVGTAAFTGSVVMQDWPDLRLSHVTAKRHHVRRRPDQQSEDCLVSLQLRGQGRVRQGGRIASLTAGTLALYDADEAYALDFDGAFEQVVVQFPRAHLAARGLDPRAVAARRCEGGMTRVSTALVRSALSNAHDLTPAGRSQLSKQVLDCLAAALASCVADDVDAQTARGALRHAVVKFVGEHLSEPGLSVERIARALHCSPRSLQRLFADQPHGLGELIRRARVDGATAALVNPARAGQSIAYIAAEHGYADAGHFARVFRERHGCTPSEHRHEQRTLLVDARAPAGWGAQARRG